MKKLTLALLLLAANIGTAFASTTLTSTVNVDNAFDIYLSTSDSTLGTFVGAGTDWPTTYTFNSTLTSGVTNYLHVVAVNQGGPGGFLGAFTLSGDNGFVFANNTDTLLTGDAGFGQNLIGFGNSYNATVDEGTNGVGPWGARSGYGTNTPDWVWNYNSSNPYGNDFNTVYFSAAITDVPEPASIALMGLGLLGLLTLRKRQN